MPYYFVFEGNTVYYMNQYWKGVSHPEGISTAKNNGFLVPSNKGAKTAFLNRLNIALI